MSDSTITVGTKSFKIGQAGSDLSRRQRYFSKVGAKDRARSDSLTSDEVNLLAALGIDEAMQASYKSMLAQFFEQLPYCRSDTSLVLSKSCEVPHYILWSVLFRSNQITHDRIVKSSQERPPLSDIEVAQMDAFLKALTPAKKSELTSVSTASPATTESPVSPTSPGSTVSPTRSPPLPSDPRAPSPSPARSSASKRSEDAAILQFFTL